MRVLLGLAVAGCVTSFFIPAHAQEWCGFLDKDHAPVRCGFISVKDCKQALGHKKNAVCMPSPSFAKSTRVGARKG